MLRGIKWIFFSLICCKNLIDCLKISKINEKEARCSPFQKLIAFRYDFNNKAWTKILGNIYCTICNMHLDIKNIFTTKIWRKTLIRIYFDNRSVIIRKVDALPVYSEQSSDNLLILYTVHFSLIFVMFVANMFADAAPEDIDKGLTATTKPCPRLSASYFSKLTYTWAIPLMWTGT